MYSWLFGQSGVIYKLTHPSIPRIVLQISFPQYINVKETGGRASFRTVLQDWGLMPLPIIQGWRLASYMVGGVVEGVKPDQIWDQRLAKRAQYIESYSIAQAALGRAVAQLEAAHALDLGVEFEAVAAIHVVETNLSAHGKTWLDRIVAELENHPKLSKAQRSDLIHFGQMLIGFANNEAFVAELKSEVEKLTEGESLAIEERINQMTVVAKSKIISAVQKASVDHSDFYNRPIRALQSSLQTMNYRVHDRAWILGRTPQNLVNRALVNLGDHGSGQIFDRVPISVQVAPGMLAKIPPGSSDLVFMSGMVPFHTAMTVNNIIRISEGLVLNTRPVETLTVGFINDPNLSFLQRLRRNFWSLPYKKIRLQAGPKIDQAIPTALAGALYSSLLIIPMNALLTYVLEPSVSWQAIKISAFSVGVASAVTAAANASFSFLSVPYYLWSQTWRMTAGINHPFSRSFLSLKQVPLNILYGLYVGWVVSHLGPAAMEKIPALKHLIVETQPPLVEDPGLEIADNLNLEAHLALSSGPTASLCNNDFIELIKSSQQTP
ncbi:MAG: hypothetical protein COV44_04630 [Deltaproteobacteria bacterium CG11_big_fil_rev_8_21_14_0_20_45_16]|nr:MAG: hypothetical protein COV44_04630 [Deltaproteobacteria bacterium CG11_big_fil_rev_8_21_14_0_20_45_16]